MGICHSRGRHSLEDRPVRSARCSEVQGYYEEIPQTYKKEGQLPGGEHLKSDDPGLALALREFMSPMKQGDYLAFNAFISPSADNLNILQSLRVAVRDGLKIATTAGFGPRYLHSTGQIHKGGAARGFYVQITANDAEDVAIPGEAYSFGTLKSAQAQGDYEALKQKGRPIIRVHLASESTCGTWWKHSRQLFGD